MEWRYLPLKIYVNFQDKKGHIASPYIRLAADIPFSTAHAFAAIWADACAGASDAEVLGFDIKAEATTLFTDMPGATSDAYRQGVLLFGTTEAEDRYIVEIPSIKESLLETTGEYAGVRIDVTLPEIQALANLLIDGNGTVAPIGLTENDLTTLITAYQRRL